ncbi:hypothetical protein QZH41_019201, partial [Actinostola sp. cb2023]
NSCNNLPCPSNRSVCRPNFITDSHDCLCLHGYEGPKCEDIDECKTARHNCPDYSICHNTNGSYDCECQSGYQRVQDKCFALSKPSL